MTVCVGVGVRRDGARVAWVPALLRAEDADLRVVLLDDGPSRVERRLERSLLVEGLAAPVAQGDVRAHPHDRWLVVQEPGLTLLLPTSALRPVLGVCRRAALR